ncbi:hypothetical protein GTA08_BOTSDO00311 [Botryosphaeria dothidea]|uniref:Uncharacterized protein n=1 Tax=Botryosphaeria dothidea TaxID=55169 RepID=A0A8H4N6X1_9PEZI|nr:hypothetical protein GTA08_BOTSDO00311 [Botryosphaeria dothidea]
MLVLLATLLLQFVHHLALAHPVNPDSIDTSVQASLLTCTGINFSGECTRQTVALGNNNCLSLDGTALSLQPDNGLDCIFYANGVCRTFLDPAAESLRVFYPGNADLSAGWSPLSFSCVALNTTEFAEENVEEEEGLQGVEVAVSSG